MGTWGGGQLPPGLKLDIDPSYIFILLQSEIFFSLGVNNSSRSIFEKKKSSGGQAPQTPPSIDARS